MAVLRSSLRLPTGSKAVPRARRNVVRSTKDTSEATPANGTVFYGGKTYTEAEFQAAAAAGKLVQPAAAAADRTSTPASSSTSFGDVMAFSGAGPELINGRLAQLGFVSAVAAEFASDEGVLRQVADEPTGVIAVFLLFTAASLVPMLAGKKPESFAFFTPAAEMMNGRAAMIGMAAMLIIEGLNNGRALF